MNTCQRLKFVRATLPYLPCGRPLEEGEAFCGPCREELALWVRLEAESQAKAAKVAAHAS